MISLRFLFFTLYHAINAANLNLLEAGGNKIFQVLVDRFILITLFRSFYILILGNSTLYIWNILVYRVSKLNYGIALAALRVEAEFREI